MVMFRTRFHAPEPVPHVPPAAPPGQPAPEVPPVEDEPGSTAPIELPGQPGAPERVLA